MRTVIRVSIIFLFVLGYFRVIGKREIGQLSPFELVLLMLIPDISQQGMIQDDYSLTGALIGLATLFSLVFLNSVLTYRFKSAENILQGRPTVLFHNGKFDERAMQRERISASDILTSMHAHGFERLDQIKWVLLEPEGKLAYIPYDQKEGAPTPESENQKTAA